MPLEICEKKRKNVNSLLSSKEMANWGKTFKPFNTSLHCMWRKTSQMAQNWRKKDILSRRNKRIQMMKSTWNHFKSSNHEIILSSPPWIRKYMSITLIHCHFYEQQTIHIVLHSFLSLINDCLDNLKPNFWWNSSRWLKVNPKNKNFVQDCRHFDFMISFCTATDDW